MLNGLIKIHHKIKSHVLAHGYGAGRQYKVYGIFGLFNFPIYYLIWLYLSPQTYESLFLRVSCTILCLLLVLHEKWPEKLKKYLPFFWYFTLCFTLPFFFSYQLIMNNGSEVWVTNTIVIVFFVLLLVDWLSAIVLLAIGSVAGVLTASFFTSELFSAGFDYYGFAITYIVAIVIGAIFAQNKQVTEKIRRRSIEAEKSSQAKTEFIANMSHDLKTPMQGLLGMLRMLLQSEEDARSVLNSKSHLSQDKLEGVLADILDQVNEYAGLALVSGERLNQFHDDVLNNVELDSGANKESDIAFNLDHLMQDVIGLQKPAAVNKKLSLTAEIVEHTPCHLKGLRQSFYRIMVNLISNAIKFTEVGEINVRVCLSDDKDTERSQVGDDVILEIRISDTGIGIPHDKFDEIFNQFSRLTSSYRGIYKGLGMGLYAVRKYVNEMKGEIRVESKVNEGSHFTVYLPFNVEKEGETQFEDSRKMPKKSGLDKKFELDKGLESDSEKTDESKKLVLLVEDDKIAAMTVRMSLTNLGCEIDWAESGEEAIEKLGQKNYKLIIMDIGLPGMTGIETAAAIRRLKDKNKANTPIVALTGHAYGKSRQLCLNAGMQSVYGKPATPEDLKKALDYFSAE